MDDSNDQQVQQPTLHRSLRYPIYRFRHASRHGPLFHRFLNKGECWTCGIETWIGFEYCRIHLLQAKRLEIRQTTRLVNGVDVTMLGLFVNDGTPLLLNPSTNLPYPSYRQNLVFPPNTSVIEYLGEPFSDVPLFQGDIVNPGVDDLAAFHARSPLLPQHRKRGPEPRRPLLLPADQRLFPRRLPLPLQSQLRQPWLTQPRPGPTPRQLHLLPARRQHSPHPHDPRPQNAQRPRGDRQLRLFVPT